MAAVWILLALWIGTFAGFFLFALMNMARDNDHVEARVTPVPIPPRRWPH
jgi:hypothetical protein